MSPSLKHLPATDRPRERLLAYGTETLTTAELMAIILGSGTQGKSVLTLAQELLSEQGSLTQLHEASVEELCQTKGVGQAKAIQLKAALALAFRFEQEGQGATLPIRTPAEAYHYVRPYLAYAKKEIFGVILLNVRSEALKWVVVSVGTLTQTLVHPREVFSPAIQHHAASLILVHNHPSGSVFPSNQDLEQTRQLLQASQTLSMPVQDHLIVSPKGYHSLRQDSKYRKIW